LPFAAANAYTLATWRLGKGIYRFDADLRVALLDTPVTGDIPTDVLKRLPEWCVYVETPGFRPSDRDIHGFFACISRFQGEDVLYLSMDMTDPQRSRVIPFTPISLAHRTIEDALRANIRRGVAATDAMKRHGVPLREDVATAFGEMEQDPAKIEQSIGDVIADVGPLLSLTLYLCAEDRELEPAPAPLSEETHTKRGARFFAAHTPRLIGVGLRLGAQLREARSRSWGERHAKTGTVIPHLRRAHWHTYLYGARSDAQERRLRWIHPTLINEHARTDDAPAVLHRVEPTMAVPPAEPERRAAT
jgi:hypothetical protein